MPGADNEKLSGAKRPRPNNGPNNTQQQSDPKRAALGLGTTPSHVPAGGTSSAPAPAPAGGAGAAGGAATTATTATTATATSATPTGRPYAGRSIPLQSRLPPATSVAGAALPAAPPTASIGTGGTGAAPATPPPATGPAPAGGAGAPSLPESMNDRGITFNRIRFSRLYESATNPQDIRVLNRTGILHQTIGLDKTVFRNNMTSIRANIPQITSIREYRDTCGIEKITATKLLTSLMSSLFYQSASHLTSIQNPPINFQYNHLTNYNVYRNCHSHMYQRLARLIGRTISLDYFLGLRPVPIRNPIITQTLVMIYGTYDATILEQYYLSILPGLLPVYASCPDQLYISIEDGTDRRPGSRHSRSRVQGPGHMVLPEKIFIRITNESQNQSSTKFYKRTLPPPIPKLPIFGATDLIGIHATIYPTLTAPIRGVDNTPVIDGYHISDYYQDVTPGQEQQYFHDIGIPVPSGNRITLDQCNARINTLHTYLEDIESNRLYINNLKQLSLYGIDHYPPPPDSHPGQQKINMKYVMVPLQWYNRLFINKINEDTIYNSAPEPHEENTQLGGSRKQLQNRRKNRITKVRSNRSRLNRRRTCRRRK